jgi:hypothetical protein
MLSRSWTPGASLNFPVGFSFILYGLLYGFNAASTTQSHAVIHSVAHSNSLFHYMLYPLLELLRANLTHDVKYRLYKPTPIRKSKYNRATNESRLGKDLWLPRCSAVIESRSLQSFVFGYSMVTESQTTE